MSSRLENFLNSVAANAAWWLVPAGSGSVMTVLAILKVYLGQFLPLAYIMLGLFLGLFCMALMAMFWVRHKVKVVREESYLKNIGGVNYEMVKLTLNITSPLNWREYFVFLTHGSVYPRACRMFFRDSYDREYEVGTVVAGDKSDRVIVEFQGERGGLPDVPTLFMELGSTAPLAFRKLQIKAK